MAPIFGFISFGDHSELAFKEALLRMHEEQSSSVKIFAEPKVRLVVATVCSKSSQPDCFPLWNQRRDIGLWLNGEVFSDAGGVDDLRVSRHSFETRAAAHAMRLYEQHGPAFLLSLNGVFSGLLVDYGRREVHLFNDRYGLGRIYYAETRQGFYFTSEAKLLLKAFPFLRRIDAQGLADFFSCGCVLSNRSLFSGMYLLPPGSQFTFGPGKGVRRATYFDRTSLENQDPLEYSEYYSQLRDMFPHVLRRYLNENDPIAMSLTGGLDGRMIMAWNKRDPGTLPCYTFGGVYRDCMDVLIARKIAKKCRQPHQVISVNNEFFGEFPNLAEKSVFISDGTMDVTGAVELWVNRIARQVASIRLTGNYGSEILRGSRAFGPRKLRNDIFHPDFQRLQEESACCFRDESNCHPNSFIAFKQVPWHHYSRFTLERSQLDIRSPYLDNDIVSLSFRAPRNPLERKAACFQLIHDGNPALSATPTDRGLSYPAIPLLTMVLHCYQETTFRAEYAYDYGMPQWLAKLDRALGCLRAERFFLGRHKFYHFRTWYRNQLAPFVRQILLDYRTLSRPYFNRKYVEDIVDAHTTGRGNYTREIHKLLSCEFMFRTLVETH